MGAIQLLNKQTRSAYFGLIRAETTYWVIIYRQRISYGSTLFRCFSIGRIMVFVRRDLIGLGGSKLSIVRQL
jgi:hypothetical protein